MQKNLLVVKSWFSPIAGVVETTRSVVSEKVGTVLPRNTSSILLASLRANGRVLASVKLNKSRSAFCANDATSFGFALMVAMTKNVVSFLRIN